MQNTEEIWRLVDAKREPFQDLSDRVWGMPELAYTETRSCAEHAAILREQGFRVTERVANIPTAVMGEAGEGGPVIAILGHGLAWLLRKDDARTTEADALETGSPRGIRLGRDLEGFQSGTAAIAAEAGWVKAFSAAS